MYHSPKPLTGLLAVLLALATACGDGGANVERNIIIASGPNKDLVIDLLDAVPAEIDGCGSFFAGNQQALDSGKYLFVDNLGEVAYVRINGVVTRLTLSVPDDGKKPVNKTVWKNNEYEITIIRKETGERQVQEDPEVEVPVKVDGVMIVKPKAGKPVVKKIVGVSGC